MRGNPLFFFPSRSEEDSNPPDVHADKDEGNRNRAADLFFSFFNSQTPCDEGEGLFLLVGALDGHGKNDYVIFPSQEGEEVPLLFPGR